MATLFGGTGGGVFVASMVSDEVYDPVYDTEMDASFIWNVLPSFYRDVMDDQVLFETVWSGMMQDVSAGVLNLWQIDYAKSLNTVPVLAQRKWVQFDLYQDVDFGEDPKLTRVGVPGTFVYDAVTRTISGTAYNRARHDRNVTPLAGSVDEETSLAWEVELTVEACQTYGSVLFGYFSSSDARLLNSISIGVIGSETLEDAPRPCIVHAAPTAGGSVSVSSLELTVGSEYRLAATYTARTGAVELSVIELRYERVTSTTGYTEGEIGEAFTEVFTDDSTNFDTLGVLVGDFLAVFGAEFEVISVDGYSLTVRPTGLAVDVTGATYQIFGESEVATLSLNLPTDSAVPEFDADQFGVGSYDTRTSSSLFLATPKKARRKSITFSTDAWRYLDPTVGEVVLSLPRLQDVVVDPAELQFEGTDYFVVVTEAANLSNSTSTIKFQEPPILAYWAEYVAYDEAYIRDNFGRNVGLNALSSDQYKAQVRGLHYSYFRGPTLASVRLGTHILVGLPISEAEGVVDSINPAYSGTLGLITVSGVDYLYPSVVGTSLQVGDEVAQFAPLSDGVEVVDYRTDPAWFAGRSGFHELEKYHSFQINLNLDAFGIDTLALASVFTDAIKPTWKNAHFLVFKNLVDEVEMTDRLLVGLILHLYDTPCDPPAVVAYDDAIYEGVEPDWAYDQGTDDWDATTAAMRATGAVLDGVVTLTNAAAGGVGAGTSFLSVLGGPGAVVDRRLAVAIYRTSTAGTTSMGSADFEDLTADFLETGREVQVGDVIDISGDDVYSVAAVVDSTHLTLNAPSPLNGSGLTYTIVGAYSTWSNVTSVANDTALTLTTVFPGVTGDYKVLLINNLYFEAYYDQFEEMCPEERVSFYMTLLPSYVGALPIMTPLPDSQTTTITVTYNAAGETKTSTLTEL